ncbi:hypothetical protein [Pseudozobellia thermophila]|uniref:Uncharacterized protein n=1 Tax=Pseudozobellia thermophila TaxID=192903 RepID=A0A1M6FIY7_9FLAO|nr:hypothetical protein [Pseudozobellia thermophila]SHI97599.1 hypothetical protein SAMN04488513_102447 [Pseudozobellia thermophila]
MNKMNKKNPFKTPENYFESFESRLRAKLSEGISDIPKDEGFSVPEGYFDSVHESILKKLETDEPKVIKLNPYKKFYYVAASIAAILLVAIVINLKSDTEPSFESLAVSDIDRYFENNEIELSTYELAEVIPVDELEVYDIMENRFAEEQMVDYLTENIEDFEALNLDYNE